MKIHIVTPTTRPQNLMEIYHSLVKLVDWGIKIKWWIVFDSTAVKFDPDFCKMDTDKELEFEILDGSKDAAFVGHAHRNKVLNTIEKNSKYKDDWFMSLDDDNVMHPDFGEMLMTYNANEYDGIIVDQIYKNGILRLKADPEAGLLHSVDTAQFLVRLKIVDSVRFNETEYCADGLFINEIYSKNKDKFLVVNLPLSYYNYLRS